MASKKKTAVTLSPRRNGLSKAARELLSRVRVAASPETIFGLEPGAAAARVQSVVGPMIEGAGLPVALLQEYRWYVAELCRMMRTVSGPDLAYCMELAMKKWLSFGLEPNTVVFLAGALFDRLAGKPDSENPESRIQKPESGIQERTQDGDRASTDYADSADGASASGTNNDKRTTMNEPTSRGGGP